MVDLIKQYSSFFIYPLLAVFVSWLLTCLCISVLPVLGFIDKPGGRHIHKRIIPRGGGIAIIVAFFSVLALYTLANFSVALPQETAGELPLFWRLFWPSVVLGTLGVIDDRWELRSAFKLFVQLVVVLIIWLTGDYQYSFFDWQMPWYLAFVLTAGWIIIIINAFNLIDGLDGLAAGLSVVSAGCLGVWFLITSNHIPEAMAMFILAASCLGFLRYNFYPAKIFMGDTGSTFIGLIFAVIGLSSVDRAVTFSSLLLPLLAIGVPIFDVFLAIWRRGMRKVMDPNAGGIMTGDQDHLHHRLLRKTHNQSTTTIYMYLIACAFGGMALLLVLLRNSVPAAIYVIVLLAVLIAIRQLGVIELVDSANVIRHRLALPRKGLLVNIFHPFIDFGAISVAFVISCLVTFGEFRFFEFFAFVFSPVALALCVSGMYRVYWLRAGVKYMFRLAITIAFGAMVSALLSYIVCFDDLHKSYGVTPRMFFAGSIIFVLLTIFLICFERFLLHYAEAFWFKVLYLQSSKTQHSVCKTLIYGGGVKCRLYVNYLYCIHKMTQEEEVIGIIDDDQALHGLNVYGFKVLGGATDLDDIYRKTPFDKIVLALPPEESRSLGAVKDFCSGKGIKLCNFELKESEI